MCIRDRPFRCKGGVKNDFPFRHAKLSGHMSIQTVRKHLFEILSLSRPFLQSLYAASIRLFKGIRKLRNPWKAVFGGNCSSFFTLSSSGFLRLYPFSLTQNRYLQRCQNGDPCTTQIKILHQLANSAHNRHLGRVYAGNAYPACTAVPARPWG